MSTLEFQKSITKELDVIKDRVRNLIGSAHWGEEGRYKEEILKNTIRRFLPNNISVGTGFINTENDISKQLDIIVFDNTKPLLFSEGDFVITTPSNVLGVIEVKSNQNVTELRETIFTFEQSVQILERNQNGNKRFYGLLSFDYDGEINTSTFKKVLSESKGIINHMSLSRKKFIRLWQQSDGVRLDPPVSAENDFYNTYEIENLSFSYFISNLVHMIADDPDDRYWFSFPIAQTKEAHRIDTIELCG
ncbi:MAG: DUF6602 domain-containing protein [Candidatus Scalindua sp.]